MYMPTEDENEKKNAEERERESSADYAPFAQHSAGWPNTASADLRFHSHGGATIRLVLIHFDARLADTVINDYVDTAICIQSLTRISHITPLLHQ